MSSRLFQEVRERQALVYSVHSGTQPYRDTGLLYVYAGTEPGNFSKVLRALMKEVRALKKDGVSAEELRRAKDHLKGNLMLSLESTSSRMNRLAKQEMRFGSFSPWTRCWPRSTPCVPRTWRRCSTACSTRSSSPS